MYCAEKGRVFHIKEKWKHVGYRIQQATKIPTGLTIDNRKSNRNEISVIGVLNTKVH